MSEIFYTKAIASQTVHKTVDEEVTLCGYNCSNWETYSVDLVVDDEFTIWGKCKRGCFSQTATGIVEAELIDSEAELDEDTLEVIELQGKVKNDSDGDDGEPEVGYGVPR